MSNNLEHRIQDYFSLDELRTTLNLDQIFLLVKGNVLQPWLASRALESEAAALSNDVISSIDDDALLILVVKVLDLDVTRLTRDEAERLKTAIDNRRIIDAQLRECGDDGLIVTSQRELARALSKDSVRKFYLYSDHFNIPLYRECMTYVGRDNAVIDVRIDTDDVIDFDACKIYRDAA